MNENNIISALNDYNGSQESLQKTVAVLSQELGDDWTNQVFQQLGGLPSDLKEKLNHVFNYYASLTAWHEAQAYLESSEPLTDEIINERFPVLKHWLDFFGQPGQDLYQQLENKAGQVAFEADENVAENLDIQEEENTQGDLSQESKSDILPEDVVLNQSDLLTETPNGNSTPTVEETINTIQNTEENAQEFQEKKEFEPVEDNSPEAFIVKKAVREIVLLENLQSWLSARCLELGDIEVFAYPYYGMLVDLMRQVVKAIQAVEEIKTPQIIGSFYEGGLEALQRKKQAIEAEIQTAVENCESDTTALIDKNVDLDQVKKTLGDLDESTENEYLGPAPDGFELMEEETPLDEKAVKEQYQQLEEQVKEKIENGKILEDEKNTSQNTQNGVQRKLSFSLKPKKS